MLDINIAVEAPEEMLEEMTVNPGGDYRLKLIQRDATYNGTPDNLAEFVFKVVQHD